MKLGFIGLGIMGSRMAANLQKKGYDLVVYNRTKSKADELVARGAVWASSPAEVARQVDVLFTMLAKPSVVEKVALGQDGFLDHLQAGKLWVDFSTVNPSFSRRMTEEAQARKVRFVDAPVAGTKGPAEKGELMIFVGGDDGDVQECQPFFEAVGRNYVHVGGHGMGTSLKMVNNLLLGQAMLAFSEAMALGQSLGLSREMLFNALLGGPVVAPFLTAKRSKLENHQYDTEFPLKLLTKDLHLASVTAYERGTSIPLTNSAEGIYALAERYGLGEQDFSAIYEFINRQAEELVSAA
jgi:3-hydroxyisobutyrate dehydrogenase/glyoxylate/succinic semialdehyde reductase